MRNFYKNIGSLVSLHLFLLPLLLTASLVTAQDATEPELNESDFIDEFVDQDSGERCINLRRLDRSEVISNQSIIFHMRGDQIFVNRLRFRCPGLSRRDTIMFETRSSRLCNLDQVTVLNEFGGRFMRGASCGLGSFYPTDSETVDLLKGSIDKRGKRVRGKGSIDTQ
ncbi:MAG: DUF6491 family protein [Pseudomonadales bacterium]